MKGKELYVHIYPVLIDFSDNNRFLQKSLLIT